MASNYKHFFYILINFTIFGLNSACYPLVKGPDGDDSNLSVILALTMLSGSGVVTETRPFRWRTVSVIGSERRIHVYDWNFDSTPSETNPEAGNITGVDDLFGSSSGRYAFMRVGSQFEIIDSTLNLSPHDGDHFHYDREKGFTRVRRERFASSNLNTPLNTSAHRVFSKSGWASFFYLGDANHPSQVRFVQEKRIGELTNNIPVWQGPTLGNSIPGEAVLISGWSTGLVALVPSASSGNSPSQFQVHKATKGITEGTLSSGWSKLTTIGNSGDISCPSFHGLAATQVPSLNAVFTNLESGYSKIHYVVISCGNNLQILTHNDDNQITELRSLPTGGVHLKNIRPLFMNDNIERGSRAATPLFIANSVVVGTDSKVYILDPRGDNPRISNFDTVSYHSHLFGSDTRSGAEIYIVSKTGFIHTYNPHTGSEIRRMESGIPSKDIANARFFGTWFGTALMTIGDSIREYNIRENFPARSISTGGTVQSMSLKGFFGIGSKSSEPSHNSFRSSQELK